MRKRVLMILFCLLFIVGLTKTTAAAVMIVVEGFGDEYPHYMKMRVAPETKDEIIMAALQDLADEFAWSVNWDESTSDISVKGNGKLIEMRIDSHKALIDSVPVDMPVSPYWAEGNIMIPINFISELLGYHIGSSKFWNNQDQIFITPYSLVSDMEIAQINDENFSQSTDAGGFIILKLKNGGKTPGGIGLNSSIWDVLQVYGVPREPERTLNYPGDWSGTLVYWGTFVPNSGMGTFYEFTFEQGLLVDLTISY